MNMKKPEMKIMRFVNEDVIATSGATPAAFELRGCFDGISDNLATFVDGIKYNGETELNAALVSKYGGNGYDYLRFYYYDDETRYAGTFSIEKLTQGSPYDNNSNTLFKNANGKYTYSEIIGNDTIVFNQIKTQ